MPANSLRFSASAKYPALDLIIIVSWTELCLTDVHEYPNIRGIMACFTSRTYLTERRCERIAHSKKINGRSASCIGGVYTHSTGIANGCLHPHQHRNLYTQRHEHFHGVAHAYPI